MTARLARMRQRKTALGAMPRAIYVMLYGKPSVPTPQGIIYAFGGNDTEQPKPHTSP